MIARIAKSVNEIVSERIEWERKKFEEILRDLATTYSFNAEESIVRLREEDDVESKVEVSRSKPSLKLKATGKPAFSLPFIKENVNVELCQGLEYNQGLFTQCSKARVEESELCVKCSEVCLGRVSERVEKGLMDFRDSTGRKPVSYVNYLKKRNISVERAREAGMEAGMDIECHLVEMDAKRGRPKKEDVDVESVVQVLKEKRGRPKKTPTKVEGEKIVDLFACAVEEALSSGDDEDEESCVVEENVLEAANAKEVVSLSQDAEKEAKKQAQEAEKEAKKQALEAEKEAKKQALEADKEAKKQALEAEKQAKKQALEAEKQAKKQAQEAEKEAKKQAQEAEKAEKAAKKQALEAEKAAKKNKGDKKNAKSEEVKKASEVVEEKAKEVKAKEEVKAEERPKVKVSEFTYNGVVYWKSTDNIMYDPKTKEVAGIWSESENKMLPAPEESDDELSEEEYDDEEEEEEEE